MRAPDEQRQLLAETIRQTARWRAAQAERYPDGAKASRRSGAGLRALANFVDGLPDDVVQGWPALLRVDARGDALALGDDARTQLGRFGLGQGFWRPGATEPTEKQMRNVLNKLDGIEAGERAARRQRAEEGYGDD